MSGTQGTGVAPAAGVPSTAEVAWALILAVAKRVTQEDRALRSGRWQLDLPTNLAGATLGLAGLGNLGAAMVGPARAFGMDVVAWSENLTDERAAEVGVRAGQPRTSCCPPLISSPSTLSSATAAEVSSAAPSCSR